MAVYKQNVVIWWPFCIHKYLCQSVLKHVQMIELLLFDIDSITRYALGIPITVRINYQTRYTMGTISPIFIMTELAAHGIGIHTTQYMIDTVCEVHLVPRSFLLICLDLAYNLYLQPVQYMIWYTTSDIYIYSPHNRLGR